MRRCERVSSRDSGRSRGSRHHKPETVTNAHYVPTFARIWPLRESGADRYVRPDSGRLGTLTARRREPSWHEPVTQEYEPISGLSTGSSLCRISHRGMSNWKNPFGWAWCPDGIRSKSVEHLCPVLTSRRLIACGGSRKSILHRPPSGNDLHLSGRGVMHHVPAAWTGRDFNLRSAHYCCGPTRTLRSACGFRKPGTFWSLNTVCARCAANETDAAG